MKNFFTKRTFSPVIRSEVLNVYSDSHGSRVSLVRDFYSATSFDYKVVHSLTFSDHLVTFTYDAHSDAFAKFLNMVSSILVL